MMQQQWYIQEDKRFLGPMSLPDVYELIDAGQVGTEAWFGLNDEWVDLETFRRSYPNPPDSYTGAPAELPVQAADATTSHLEALDDAPPVIERDAILILGRRRAGKTIYLATLYSTLWKSVTGLTMKAVSGRSHKMLMTIVEQLRRGEWPEATLGTSQLEFEINDHGRKRLLIAFDYSGEDFRRAFVDEDMDSTEAKALLKYVDRAAAVILLIDPSVAVSGKHEEAIEDDFGMVQAVQRIRDWHNGEDVPVVLVLTKADRNRDLIRSHGSAANLVLRNYPALARTLRRVVIFPVQAVQESTNGDGHTLPRSDSVAVNVEQPLHHCLKEMHRRERQQRRETTRIVTAVRRAKLERDQAEMVARSNRRLAYVVGGIIILAMCFCAAMYMVLS